MSSDRQQRRRRIAYLPKKPDGLLVNAALLVDHAATCGRRDLPNPWLIQFWPGMFDEQLEYRDGAGRHRDPARGAREWIKFRCASEGCPATISLRLGALERAAEEIAKEAMPGAK